MRRLLRIAKSSLSQLWAVCKNVLGRAKALLGKAKDKVTELQAKAEVRLPALKYFRGYIRAAFVLYAFAVMVGTGIIAVAIAQGVIGIGTAILMALAWPFIIPVWYAANPLDATKVAASLGLVVFMLNLVRRHRVAEEKQEDGHEPKEEVLTDVITGQSVCFSRS